MVGGESDSIANICCKKKDYARLSLPHFSKDTKSLWSSAPGKKIGFTYSTGTYSNQANKANSLNHQGRQTIDMQSCRRLRRSVIV